MLNLIRRDYWKVKPEEIKRMGRRQKNLDYKNVLHRIAMQRQAGGIFISPIH